MAIAFVGAGAYHDVSTGSISLARYATIAAGDTILAFVSVLDKAGTSTIVTPSGWTLVGSVTSPSNGGYYNTLYVFWLTAGSSEPSSYSWSAGVQGTGFTGMDGVVVTYSGCAATSLINSHATGQTTGATLTVGALSETFVSGELYVGCISSSANQVPGTPAPSPALTQRFSNGGQWESYWVGDYSPTGAPSAETYSVGGAWDSVVGVGLTLLPFGSSGGAVAIGGAGSLFAAGSAAPQASVAASGTGLRFAAGSLSTAGGASVSISGSGSLFAVGALQASVTATMGGAGSPFAAANTVATTAVLPSATTGVPFDAGTLGASSGGAIALSGMGSPVAAGSFAASGSDTEVLSGSGSRFAAGGFGVSSAGAVALAGARSPFNAGSLGVSVSDAEAVVGAGSLFAPGALAVVGGGVASLPGTGSAFTAGAFSPSISDAEPLAGVGSLFGAGSFAQGASRAAIGAASPYGASPFAVARQGGLPGAGSPYSAASLGPTGSDAIALPGAGALFAAGALSPTAGAVIPLSGARSPCAAGAFATSASQAFTIVGVGAPVAASGMAPGVAISLLGARVQFASGSPVAVPISGQVDLVGAASNANAGGFVQQSQRVGLVGAVVPFGIAQFANVHPFVPRSQVMRIVGRSAPRKRIAGRDHLRNRIVVGAAR